MNTKRKLLLAAMASVIGLGFSVQAAAHDDRDHRHRHDHWNRDHYSHQHVVRERVVVERPVYIERHVEYAPPPPRYPGVVVSIDIPPLIFPIR
jgi:hypothetical protein